MLTRLRLRNFQRHDELKIGIKEPILAITGPSDKGKSSLCRAIRWLTLNKPRGSGFIRWGQKSCSVKIRLDGHDIERIKDSKGNRYILDQKEFKAAGNDVPGDIGALLAMGPENFAQQHDPPFWFDRTPGELAKELNKIVDLEVIDRAIAEVSSRLRKGRSTEEVCSQRLAQAEERAKELEWVPRFAEELESVTELQEEVLKQDADLTDLKESLVEVAECQETIRSARGFVDAGRLVLVSGDVYKEAKQESQKLNRLVENISEQRQDIVKIRYNRDEAKKRLAEESEGRCPICGGELKDGSN